MTSKGAVFLARGVVKVLSLSLPPNSPGENLIFDWATVASHPLAEGAALGSSSWLWECVVCLCVWRCVGAQWVLVWAAFFKSMADLGDLGCPDCPVCLCWPARVADMFVSLGKAPCCCWWQSSQWWFKGHLHLCVRSVHVACGASIGSYFLPSSPAYPTTSCPIFLISGLPLLSWYVCEAWCWTCLEPCSSVLDVNIHASSGERLHRPTVWRPSSQDEEARCLLRRWTGWG
jgi:hypothetical protein